MGFFAHAQTVDTRPLFPPTTWPGYEATPRIDKEVKEQLKRKGKDAHWGAEKPLYKIQEQVLDVSGPLTCLWADLMRKEASHSAEDVLVTVTL